MLPNLSNHSNINTRNRVAALQDGESSAVQLSPFLHKKPLASSTFPAAFPMMVPFPINAGCTRFSLCSNVCVEGKLLFGVVRKCALPAEISFYCGDYKHKTATVILLMLQYNAKFTPTKTHLNCRQTQ